MIIANASNGTRVWSAGGNSSSHRKNITNTSTTTLQNSATVCLTMNHVRMEMAVTIVTLTMNYYTTPTTSRSTIAPISLMWRIVHMGLNVLMLILIQSWSEQSCIQSFGTIVFLNSYKKLSCVHSSIHTIALNVYKLTLSTNLEEIQQYLNRTLKNVLV